MCVGITIIKWDSTCHSQTHGTEPPVHFCCSHYISPCFLSTPPLSFSLSLSLAFSFSLSLSLSLPPLSLFLVARHMPSDALYQIFSSWSILLFHIIFHIISFHGSYKILQLFTDYLLRLPSSELLEKHLFSLSGQPSSSSSIWSMLSASTSGMLLSHSVSRLSTKSWRQISLLARQTSKPWKPGTKYTNTLNPYKPQQNQRPMWSRNFP